MITCERIANEILPAVRAFLAKELMRSGMNQTDIAETLQITQPAVSQYLKHARAKQIDLVENNRAVAEELEALAADLAPGRTLSNERLEDLCHEIADRV